MEHQESALPDSVAAVIRHVVTAAGGALIADGVISQSSSSYVELAGGIAVALGGIAWSIWQKIHAKKNKAAAVQVAASTAAITHAEGQSVTSATNEGITAAGNAAEIKAAVKAA
jgi:hypothetical protein